MEKRKISFILFHEIHNIVCGNDCQHYTVIHHSIACLRIRQHVVSSLRYESLLGKMRNTVLFK